jgi:hypothetical protein
MNGACTVFKLFENFYYFISATFKNNKNRRKFLTQIFVYNPKEPSLLLIVHKHFLRKVEAVSKHKMVLKCRVASARELCFPHCPGTVHFLTAKIWYLMLET